MPIEACSPLHHHHSETLVHLIDTAITDKIHNLSYDALKPLNIYSHSPRVHPKDVFHNKPPRRRYVKDPRGLPNPPAVPTNTSRPARSLWDGSVLPAGKKGFQEYWGGCAELSRQCCAKGLYVFEPFEAYPPSGYLANHDLNDVSIRNRELERAKSGIIGAAHMGITCRTWTLLYNNLNSGTRTRERPLGTLERQDEINANDEVTFMLKLVNILVDAGAIVTIENPLTSYLLKHPGIERLLHRLQFMRFDLDMCVFGLRSPPGSVPREIWKKPTSLLANHAAFEALARRCQGAHVHTTIHSNIRVHGKSMKRSVLAGAYPKNFCVGYARCLCEVAQAAFMAPNP
jgi:hypothetical protein